MMTFQIIRSNFFSLSLWSISALLMLSFLSLTTTTVTTTTNVYAQSNQGEMQGSINSPDDKGNPNDYTGYHPTGPVKVGQCYDVDILDHPDGAYNDYLCFATNQECREQNELDRQNPMRRVNEDCERSQYILGHAYGRESDHGNIG